MARRDAAARTRAPQVSEASSAQKLIVIWSERGRFMMATPSKKRKGLIRIAVFQSEQERSRLIAGLGNREVKSISGDPAVIRTKLLGLFGGKRVSAPQPIEIYKPGPSQNQTPVFVAWSAINHRNDRLQFMLAIGTTTTGLKTTKSFDNELQRQTFLRTLSANPRVIRIQQMRPMAPHDLDRLIREYRPSPARGMRGKRGRAAASTPSVSVPLTGAALLARHKELEGLSQAEIVRRCSYQIRRMDGTNGLNYTGFCEALTRATLAASPRGGSGCLQVRPRASGPAVGGCMGLSSDDLLRLPKRGTLSRAALRRREELARELYKQEVRLERARQRREELRRKQRALYGLDEPDAPEDAMKFAWLAGPGQGRRA